MTDTVLSVSTVEQLVSFVGMTFGEATELKLAASSALLMASAGGGAAATGALGSISLGSLKPIVTSVVSSTRFRLPQ